MRRDVVIALFVLIPVAILISLSLGERAGGEGENTSAAPTKIPGVVMNANVRDAGIAPSPQPLSPRERERPTSITDTVMANARQCLSDQKTASVEVHFTPTREGRYADVKVSTQDPYLAACLEDVFEESKWNVSASATESFAPTSFQFTAAQ
ncbi:MAG: hypothetical protein JNM17_09895 [Archangium sp.]|nr:hypothetical protein [Archangium sp.]